MNTISKQSTPDDYFANKASRCYGNGWLPIPILPGERKPNLKKWNDLDISAEQISAWCKSRPASGVGLRTDSPLIAIDVDTYRDEDLDEDVKVRSMQFSKIVQACLMKKFGDGILIRRNGTVDRSRFLVPLQCAEPLRKSVIEFLREDYPDEIHKIEILGVSAQGKGNQFVAFGYRSKDGGEYAWDGNRSPANTRVAELADCSYQSLLEAFNLAKKQWHEVTGVKILTEAERFKTSVICETDITGDPECNVVHLRPLASGSCSDIAIAEFREITRFVLLPKSEGGLGYADADRETFLNVLRAYQDRDPSDEGLAWFINVSKTKSYPDESADITRDWNSHTRTDFDGQKVHASSILYHQTKNIERWNRYKERRSRVSFDDHHKRLDETGGKTDLLVWAEAVKSDGTLSDSHRLQLIPYYRSRFQTLNGINPAQADARSHLFPVKEKASETSVIKKDFALQIVDRILQDAFLYVDDHGAPFFDYHERLGLPVEHVDTTFLIDEIALELYGKSIDDRDIKKIKRHLFRHCKYSGNVIKTFMRYGRSGDRYFVDLRDQDNTVIEYSTQGMKVSDAADLPIRFRKGADGIALPTPFEISTDTIRSGIKNSLFSLVNVTGEIHQILFLSSMVNTMLAAGESPIFLFAGSHGSGKSTVARQWRDSLDPQSYALTGLPRTGRDFGRRVAADTVTVIDNVKNVSASIEDFLCRVAEGSPDAGTTFFAETGEVKTDVTGTLAFTSTETQIFKQPDLNSRQITIPITAVDGEALTKNQIFIKTRAAQPEIFSLLIALTIEVLKLLPTIKQGKYRYGDYEMVFDAISKFMGVDQKFCEWWAGELEIGIVESIDQFPVLLAVLDFVVVEGPWNNTAGRLLEVLNRRERIAGRRHRDKAWPHSGDELRALLREHTKALRLAGLDVEKGKRSGSGVRWKLTLNANAPTKDDIHSAYFDDIGEADLGIETSCEPDI